MEKKHVEEIFAQVLAKLTSKTEEEILADIDLAFNEDYGLTSMEYFPLIAELEDRLDLEIDYSEFLTKALNVRSGAAYIYEVMKR